MNVYYVTFNINITKFVIYKEITVDQLTSPQR